MIPARGTEITSPPRMGILNRESPDSTRSSKLIVNVCAFFPTVPAAGLGAAFSDSGDGKLERVTENDRVPFSTVPASAMGLAFPESADEKLEGVTENDRVPFSMVPESAVGSAFLDSSDDKHVRVTRTTFPASLAIPPA